MKTVSVGSRNWAVGVQTRDIPASVQHNFIGGRLVVTRESWPAGVNYTLSDGTVLSNVALVLALERTQNGGASWEPVASTTCIGGTKLKRDGTPQLTDFMTVQFNGPDGPIALPGDLRVSLNFLVALRTGITADLFEEGDVVVPASVQQGS